MSDTDTGRERRPGSPARSTATSTDGTQPMTKDTGHTRPLADPDPAHRMSAGELVELEERAESESAAATPPARTRPGTATGGTSEPGGSEARHTKVRLGDVLFSGTARGAGVLIVLVIAAVAAFLVIRAVPALSDDKVNFLTSREWNVEGNRFGIASLLWVTVVSSVIAMLVAVPVGVGIALFVTMYAPKRLAGPVARTVDLLAAIPSIVYGVWGLLVFGSAIRPVADFLQAVLGWIPLFGDVGGGFRTIFTGGIVLAIMILPIITAVSRDVFERTPRANIEASLALGATRWEMIRMAVLPYGKAGVVSGAMLGLGRALGETIAVTLILASIPPGQAFVSSIFTGGETFASRIALDSGEFSNPASTGPYIAAGLMLFVLTFVVNAIARVVVAKGTVK